MKLNRLFSVAPMMGYTDRHARYFFRLISPHSLLYTEMITMQALHYGDTKKLLLHHPFEYPLALQLGGNHPKMLAQCAKMGEDAGYQEINLNVGCPSDRVKSGNFGACLMLDPPLVADCIHAMISAVQIPVTIKCRIGVDHHDSYSYLINFIDKVNKAGCEVFIIHARKAWLNGLSPKENREIPPLQYETVQQIKKDFPKLTIVINGGIKKISDIPHHIQTLDGVMVGREVYANPYLLSEVEKVFYHQSSISTRFEIIENYIPYIETQLKRNIKLSNMTRHLLGIFQDQRGGKLWRRLLSGKKFENIDIIVDAMNQIKVLQQF